jgi:outer membrane protein assembly factor BamB
MSFQSPSNRIKVSLATGLCLLGIHLTTLHAADDHTAVKLIEQSRVKGGLVIHLGCGSGELTRTLRINNRYQVHGLDRDAKAIDASRRMLLAAGVYGQVTASRLAGNELPLVDGLVNLLVVDTPLGIAQNEMIRVLAPGGVLMTRVDSGWKRFQKPRPADIDDWTHYLHDSSGNAVAHDAQVGPPRHMQWIGSPRWSRHHDRMASLSAMVSGNGRLFYIMDEGSRVSIQLPADWKLIARDAFNGTVLWKLPLSDWHSHLWPLKSGPTQLARRLVTDGQRVFVTMGLKAPLSVLDAATGDRLHDLPDSAGTEELVVHDGSVFAMVNDGDSALLKYNVQLNLGDQARVAREFQWNRKPRRLVAWDVETGRKSWQISSPIAPLTLVAGPKRVYYHDGNKIIARDRKTGRSAWTADGPIKTRINFNFGPKLVLYKDVLLFAGGDRTMRSLDAATGKLLWIAPHDQSGYQSPEDLLVMQDLVWSAPTTRTKDSGVYTGRNPRTGKIAKTFSPNVQTYWFHHRCYIAKATDRFLLPSRTGIEFVDPKQQSWDIHHWVRGGCLYGIMPCNGLVYAPPHNCACYPEAKLYGLNVLAPTSATRRTPKPLSDQQRLRRGPAFEQLQKAQATQADPGDWPTYRHDRGRSGSSPQTVPAQLGPAWQSQLQGRLTSVVVADGRLFVAEIDRHTLYALDADSGKTLWSHTVGGRIDSPPTIHGPRVLFGSADGQIHCLRANDGALGWSFQAAPADRRLMAFEQLESAWPVHGSPLVRDGIVYSVSGRSTYLDGGLRLLRLDARTGYKLSETLMDDKDPKTGKNLQTTLQTLQMPVGLPDILSASDDRVFMRSQEFSLDGERLAMGPHSGNPAVQGSVQKGKTAHLFAPMGFLDGTYFHRAYWVFGRSFAGGHAGYFQAGKFTPSGRLLVTDGQTIFGFGRKPQYYRWTTTIEHQLFAAPTTPPEQALSKVDENTARQNARRGNTSMVHVPKTAALNPKDKTLTIEAWVRTERNSGVVVARGGPAAGFALIVANGKPRFLVRNATKLTIAAAETRITGRWVHLAGRLAQDGTLQLFLDGKPTARAKADGLLTVDPVQSMEIGGDDQTAVGAYKSPYSLTGQVDDVRLYFGPVTDAEIAMHHAQPSNTTAAKAKLVLDYDFDQGRARDKSSHQHDGQLSGAQTVKARRGLAVKFVGRATRQTGSFVKPVWKTDVPVIVRAMAKAGSNLFVMGPPDLVDEEESFRLLVGNAKTIQKNLARQDAALRGAEGGILLAVSATDGRTLARIPLDALPTWDGLIAAQGRLYLSTTDGRVICLSPKTP